MARPRIQCMNPSHKGAKIKSRGLCGSCYQAAQKLVKNKVTTWSKLETTGKALPAKRSRSKYTSDIQLWLLDKS